MKTTYPSDPSKDYNEWIKHLTQYGMTPEDKFEAEFMRIWSDLKSQLKTQERRNNGRRTF